MVSKHVHVIVILAGFDSEPNQLSGVWDHSLPFGGSTTELSRAVHASTELRCLSLENIDNGAEQVNQAALYCLYFTELC